MTITINGFGKGFLFSKKLVITLENNCFTTTRTRDGRTDSFPFSEIALLKLDTGFMVGFPHKARRRLWCIDKNGKAVFCCSNKKQQEWFEKFVTQAKQKLSSIEKVRYSKQGNRIMSVMIRTFFINPQYEQSKILKRIWRRSGFYYEPLLFAGICLLFIIALNCFFIFAPREWTDAFNTGIQNFVLKYFL